MRDLFIHLTILAVNRNTEIFFPAPRDEIPHSRKNIST